MTQHRGGEGIALVTGATGFIGSHLVRTLRSAGRPVRALIRDSASAASLASAGVETLRGDLRDPDSLRGIGAGVDVVFHAAAQVDLPGITPEEYQRSNVVGTRNLVDALERESVRRFVFLSSIAAIGIRPLGKVDETVQCRPDLVYGVSKLSCEEYLRSTYRTSGFPAVILRPPTVYGSNEHFNFLKLCRAIRSRRFAIIGAGKNRIDFCWVGNLVHAMIQAAERGRSGEVYHVADEPVLPFRETADILSRLVRGCALSRVRLPLPLAYGIAFPLAAIGAALRTDVPLTPKRVRTMAGDLCFDLAKSRRELGYRPAGTFAEHARETVEWYWREGLLERPAV